MKYKHPTLGREAKHFETDTIANGYKIIDKNGLLVFGDNRTDKNTLFALGFQPVEETTNDWIDEACTEYMNNEALAFQNDSTFDTEKFFREAIKKHMPKQSIYHYHNKETGEYTVTKDPSDALRQADDIITKNSNNHIQNWYNKINNPSDALKRSEE